MTDFIARAKVVAQAAVTYLTVAGALLTILVEELTGYIDNSAVEWVLKIAGISITAIGVAVSIIRRSIPVVPDERGVLSPYPPMTTAQADAERIRDMGASTIITMGAMSIFTFALLVVVVLLG